MSARRIHLGRLGIIAATIVLGGVGCAEKTLSPNSPELSPRFSLRVTTLTPAAAIAQNLLVAAVYVSSVNDTSKGDTLRILDTVSVPVTGSAQNVTLKVDITQCLLDPTRKGSTTACSLKIGAFLEPASVTGFDNIEKSAYDIQLVGPFDATPGHPPVIPTIDLHTDAFVINHWESDPAFDFGGLGIPQGTSGPLTGIAGSGTSSPTLFLLTAGADTSIHPTSPNQQIPFGPQLAIYQNGSWRRVQGPPSTQTTNPGQGSVQFTDVAAFAPNDVYISAGDGLYHYDGSSISAVSSVRDNLRSLAVSPPSASGRALIAGTQSGSVWFSSNLTTFAKSTFASIGQIDGVCVNGPNEAFAMNRSSGSVYRFDGTNWTQTNVLGNASRVDLQCLGPGQAYVFNGGSSQTAMLKWNGTSWVSAAGPSANNRSMNWSVVSANEIYAAGDSANVDRAFYRFDGSTWREIGRLRYTGGAQPKPWADPRGGMYLLSTQSTTSRIETANANGARVLAYRPALRDAVMPTSSSAFVVGANMFIGRLSGTSWIIDAPPSGSPTNVTLLGVWADGASNAWAVGGGSTIAHWDGTRWSAISDSRRPVGTADTYLSVWGSAGTVWIGGQATMLKCRSVTTCAPESLPVTGGIFGIWGTSASNVYAVGDAGHVLHFDGTSWANMQAPTSARFSRVYAPAANDVFVFGDTVVYHYDGAAWHNSTRDIFDQQSFGQFPSQSFELGVWAASPKELYVGTIYGMRKRGVFDWTSPQGPFDQGGRVNAISGPAGGCGIAITDGTSLNGLGPILIRGVGPTGCNASPFTAPSSWP